MLALLRQPHSWAMEVASFENGRRDTSLSEFSARLCGRFFSFPFCLHTAPYSTSLLHNYGYRFLATDSFHIVSGVETMTIRNKSSISRYIHRVAAAVASKSDRCIYMSRDAERERIKRQFYEIAGFPGVIGV